MALRCLDFPASHVTLSRSLPSELSLPVSDVQVTGWHSSSLPWEVQHSVALSVAVIDTTTPVAECARRWEMQSGPLMGLSQS